MPRSFTDEAIVLRAHNVGETDRFCLLLTKESGRITVRIPGARKIQSRRGRGFLPLHRIRLTWQEHSFGNSVTASECLDAHAGAWKDAHRFSCATQGIELLMKLTEEGTELPDLFDLTTAFLSACDSPSSLCFAETGPSSPLILSVYTLKLLKTLGYLPSADSAPVKPSMPLANLLDTLDDLSLGSLPDIDEALVQESMRFIQGLVGNQLGVSLRSPDVRRSISSGVTPICQ